MGTRYNEGDTVEVVEGRYAREIAEVTDIRNPDSDSPVYEVRFQNPDIDVGVNYHKASQLRKEETPDIKEGQTVKRYEGQINGMDEYVMYQVKEVKEDSYVLYRLGDDVGKEMEEKKETFEEPDIKVI